MKLLCTVTLALLMAAAPACAKDNGHGHGKPDKSDKHHGKSHHDGKHGDGDVNINLIFGEGDRRVIHEYYSEHYRHCPPGLAKKHNGCMPPGQYKKYVRGEYLPADVIWEPVPAVLLTQLHSVPHGYRYVMVDKNVLLIAEASKKIIDAVTLLSAVD